MSIHLYASASNMHTSKVRLSPEITGRNIFNIQIHPMFNEINIYIFLCSGPEKKSVWRSSECDTFLCFRICLDGRGASEREGTLHPDTASVVRFVLNIQQQQQQHKNEATIGNETYMSHNEILYTINFRKKFIFLLKRIRIPGPDLHLHCIA